MQVDQGGSLFLNKYLKYIKIELATSIQPMGSSLDPSHSNYYKTSINPTTGLPISGSVDVAGNITYGASHDDYYRRASSNDEYRYRDYYNSINNYNNPHRNYNNSSCSFRDRY